MYKQSDKAIFQRPGTKRAALKSLPVTLGYLFFAWLLLLALPDRAWNLKTQALVAMSLFGIWRYSWQVLHVFRHWRYSRHLFPALKQAAMSLDTKFPTRLYIMVPSYKEEFKVSQIVFEALVKAAQTIPSKVYIYASVGSEEEVEFISKVINSTPGHDRVETVFMYQEQGKRVAMGHALRAIARDFNDPLKWHPDSGNDLVVFMDGDTLVEPEIFLKTLPYFRSNPKLGALTPDNLGVSPDASGVFNDWYTVKFAQRNHIFYSHSLSKRVLTVTGRFSIYRADIVVNEDFIRFLEADHLDHWLFGRFRFLMGDDKSTWFYLLKQGMEMLYIPDAVVVALEMRQKNFFATSLSLMHRWYGNMLRNNWRAVRLGPKPMGFFIWWCILDQRFSTFTPLIGPISVLLLSFFDSWFYLVFYVSWVILTRLCMMWVYVLEGMQLRVLHIPLVLYNQWVGAVMKIYSMHNLSSQSWNKNGASEQIEAGPIRSRVRALSKGGQLVAFGLMRTVVRMGLLAFNTGMLVMVCGVISGVFILPGMAEITQYNDRWLPHDGGRPFVSEVSAGSVERLVKATSWDAVRDAVADTDDETPLHILLPAGEVAVNDPLVIQRSGVRIEGSGQGKTSLISTMSVEQGSAVIDVQGRKGPVVTSLISPAAAGAKVLFLQGWSTEDQYIWLGAPNDASFFDKIGDEHWRQQKPWIRQFIAEVSTVEKEYVILRQPLPFAFPAGTEVRSPRMVTDVSLSGFTVTQKAGDLPKASVVGVYENSVPEFAVDALRFDWASNCRVSDVGILNAGRHPLVFENSRNIVATKMLIDGAWNKGKGGNGYVRFARSHDCLLSDSRVANIRHLAFQWGATGNTVERSSLTCDVNFHGGYSQHNTVRETEIDPPASHPWGQVTRMPAGGAAWAPPDGNGNEVY